MNSFRNYMKNSGKRNWMSLYVTILQHARQHKWTVEQELAARDRNFHLLQVFRGENALPPISFDEFNGGVIIRCLNYAKKGESKYQACTTKGVVTYFDDKQQLIQWIKESVR